MYSWQPERGAWQAVVHLRAVCQEVIPVVAIHGIWPRNLANDRIPAPAILHRHVSCLLLCCVINFWSATLQVQDTYASDCLGLNLTPMVLIDTPSRDTTPLIAGVCNGGGRWFCAEVCARYWPMRHQGGAISWALCLNSSRPHSNQGTVHPNTWDHQSEYFIFDQGDAQVLLYLAQ
jgi:hypothetical protein